jgi:hypothetical protein
VPELELGIGAEHRHDALAKGAKKLRVPEHLADLHGELVEQARKPPGVVEQAVLELAEVPEARTRERGAQAPLDGIRHVLA